MWRAKVSGGALPGGRKKKWGGCFFLHVGKVRRDDEAVVAYEGFSGCADAFFAVGG